MANEIADSQGQAESVPAARRNEDSRVGNQQTKANEQLALPAIVLNTAFILIIQAMTIVVFCH